jgi:hypothetical protein
MFEDNKVFESISASWEKTDQYAKKLFRFTLVFVLSIFFAASIITFTIPVGILQTLSLAFIDYVFTIPLGYIYFTLYKSLKVSEDQLSKS